MTDEERIEHLMTTPPVVLTRRERVERAVMRVCGFLSVVAFAVAAAALIVDASASCVNSALATRNGPSQRDAAAHVAFANAQGAYDRVNKQWHVSLSAVLVAPKAQQLALYRKFLADDRALILAANAKQTANIAYRVQLEADQATRSAHPLGEC